MNPDKQCLVCKHQLPWQVGQPLRCTAFPDGIPEPLATEKIRHTQAYPGDNGIRFEPLPEYASVFEETRVSHSDKTTSAVRRRVTEKTNETKRSAALKYVDKLIIEVPVMSYEVLVQKACKGYNSRLDHKYRKEHHYLSEPRATTDSDPSFLERISVNYLRHQLTSYERNLVDLFGEKGKNNAVKEIRKKVYIAIAQAYPQLAEECKAQLKRRS